MFDNWFRRRVDNPFPAVIVRAEDIPNNIQEARTVGEYKDIESNQKPTNFREQGLRPVADIGGDWPA